MDIWDYSVPTVVIRKNINTCAKVIVQVITGMGHHTAVNDGETRYQYQNFDMKDLGIENARIVKMITVAIMLVLVWGLAAAVVAGIKY